MKKPKGNMYATEDARDELRKFLVRATGCDIQGGYPCGTCIMDLLDRLGLDNEDPQYHERSKNVDRCNEVWRAILQIREQDPKFEDN